MNDTTQRCLDPIGPLTLSNFRADWATPHEIELAWDVTPPPGQQAIDVIAAYEIMVRKVGSTTVEVIDSKVNPELGTLVLTDKPNAKDFVHSSIVYGREPGTDYDVSLVAIPKVGQWTASGPIRVHTPSPKKCVPILDHGQLMASGVKPGVDDPPKALRTDAGVEWTASTNNKWQNVGVDGAYALDAGVPSLGGPTTPGYVTFDVTVLNNPTAEGYSGLTITFPQKSGAGCGAADCNFHLEGWVLRRDGSSHRYELPLYAFKSTSTALSQDVLGTGLADLIVGSQWSAGTTVRVETLSLCAF